MIPSGNADDPARLLAGTARHGQHIKQSPRTQKRIDTWPLYLTENGYPLSRVFLGKDGNLRMSVEAAILQFFRDQALGLIRGESSEMHRTNEVQGGVSVLIDPYFLVGIRCPEDTNLQKIAATDGKRWRSRRRWA